MMIIIIIIIIIIICADCCGISRLVQRDCNCSSGWSRSSSQRCHIRREGNCSSVSAPLHCPTALQCCLCDWLFRDNKRRIAMESRRRIDIYYLFRSLRHVTCIWTLTIIMIMWCLFFSYCICIDLRSIIDA